MLQVLCQHAYLPPVAESLPYLWRHEGCMDDIAHCRKKLGPDDINHPCFEYHAPIYSKKYNRNFTNKDCFACLYGEMSNQTDSSGVAYIDSLEHIVVKEPVASGPYFLYHPGNDTLVLSEYANASLIKPLINIQEENKQTCVTSKKEANRASTDHNDLYCGVIILRCLGPLIAAICFSCLGA